MVKGATTRANRPALREPAGDDKEGGPKRDWEARRISGAAVSRGCRIYAVATPFDP